jgi:hypothetical protein
LRMLAFAISVTLTLTCRCYSQWDGRPWHENTNAVSWHYLNAEYKPFEQLFDALVERADAVRAVANTNFPFLQYTQTWDFAVGLVTNVTGSNDLIIVSGFPLGGISGKDFNGYYAYNTGDGWWENVDDWDLILSDVDIGWGTKIWNWELYDFWSFFPEFGSDVGPESTAWVDDTDAQVDGGKTEYAPESVEVVPVMASVTTTNAFSAFDYSVVVDGTSYTGTGYPHLAWATLEWVDQQIENLSAYYVPVYVPTNGATNLLYWDDDWAANGELSLIGNAGVGLTVTGEYITVGGTTNEYVSSRFTRQPEIAQNWLLAEYHFDGSNWVEIVNNEFNSYLSPDYAATGPYVKYVSATGGVGSADVSISGLVASAWHWFNGSKNATNETVATGNHATNLWMFISGAVVTAAAAYTGDYVAVYYDEPITLYGERPRRLYALDLDERAAVIDRLRYLQVSHNWIFSGTWKPETTNYFITDTLTHTYQGGSIGTNNPSYPSWDNLFPVDVAVDFEPFLAQNLFTFPLLQYYFYIETDVSLDIFDVPTGYASKLVAYTEARRGNLVYDINFSTNNMQGDSITTNALLTTLGTVVPAQDSLFDEAPMFNDDPYVRVDERNDRLVWVATNAVTFSSGINTMLSGQIGYDIFPPNPPTNMPRQTLLASGNYIYGGSNWYENIPFVEYPDDPDGTGWNDGTYTKIWGAEDLGNSGAFGVTMSLDYQYQEPRRPIPSVLDFGVTNGFRFRAEE